LDLLPGPRKGARDVSLLPDSGGGAVFFMTAFHGWTHEVVTLAHEVAHVVHSDLMEASQVSPLERWGAGYILEGVAKVNELLVLEELARHAQNPMQRAFYLRELTSKLVEVRYTTMYWAVVATKFELELTGLIARGAPAGSAVHDLWLRLNTELDPTFAEYEGNKYMWAAVPNFSSDPRAYAKYMYAWVIAMAIYERATTDKTAMTGLVALMKAGFVGHPFDLVRTHLGVDLSDPQCVKDALKIVEVRLAEFEAALR
jgi:oligoendopeptidase F